MTPSTRPRLLFDTETISSIDYTAFHHELGCVHSPVDYLRYSKLLEPVNQQSAR